MPVFNTTPITPEIREQLTIMADTDIRTLLANLEAAAQLGAQNATTIASQGVTLADVKATAVVEKNFTLQKAAFVLEGDVYRALIQHDMGSKFPGVTIYDNAGDLQLAEFIALDPASCKLELTATQWADNDFPLTVNLQARNVATVAQPTGMIGYAVPNSNYMVRLNRTIQRLERQLNGTSTWEIVRDDQIISAAKIASDGWLHVILGDGATYVFTDVGGGSWQGSNSGNYDGLTTATGAIVL